MKVSDKVIREYKDNSITKHIALHFPQLGIDVGTVSAHSETMNLTEAIFNKDSIEFVGCIASKFSIKVNGLKEDVKGKELTVDIYTDDTADEPVRLFKGIVDSAVKTSNKQAKEIVAYDELYTKGNTEVAAWYKSQKFPETIRDFRYSLFAFLGIEQVEITLPNDDIVIDRQYDPNTLQAIAVIKAICQINGAFGIMNREGKFEYRIMGDIYDDGTYPGVDLFPGPDTFPGAGSANIAAIAESDIEETAFSFYKSVQYEEFEVKPVDKVTIRQSEDDAGTTYGSGTNNYIIQGNMFTYGLSKTVLQTVAENVYNAVQGFSYIPYRSDNNGLPFVECGKNVVSYMVIDYEATFAEDNVSGDIIYEEKQFPILSRTLSGIQALRDNYSADGEEYQSEFITDLQTQIDLLKKSGVTRDYVDNKFDDFASNYYDMDEIDDMFANLPSGGGDDHQSVADLPVNPDPNIVYLIQGVVVVK